MRFLFDMMFYEMIRRSMYARRTRQSKPPKRKKQSRKRLMQPVRAQQRYWQSQGDSCYVPMTPGRIWLRRLEWAFVVLVVLAIIYGIIITIDPSLATV